MCGPRFFELRTLTLLSADGKLRAEKRGRRASSSGSRPPRPPDTAPHRDLQEMQDSLPDPAGNRGHHRRQVEYQESARCAIRRFTSTSSSDPGYHGDKRVSTRQTGAHYRRRRLHRLGAVLANNPLRPERIPRGGSMITVSQCTSSSS